MASVPVIAKARDRIAKFRDAKKIVRASCDAASPRASQASTSHHTLSRLLKILIVVV